jgi:cyanophycinase
MIRTVFFQLLGLLFLITACTELSDQPESAPVQDTKGKLYIIGGGKRPPAMVREMIRLSGVDTAGYIAVLPMSSIEPDTAFYYTKRQFFLEGLTNVINFHFEKGDPLPESMIDSLVHAKLIYLPGGEQLRFMEFVGESPVYEALHKAYRNGAVIAGTSAGAAVMSKKMITGNEFKHPVYTGNFCTIEAENMELVEGMGFLENVIIDQHFIRRMRMNRLISVAIENPGNVCIGIDESTAIVVEGDSARVTGDSQVVVLKSTQEEYSVKEGLLGAENIKLNVYLPGDVFQLR